MDLDTIRAESLNAETSIDDQVNTSDSAKEHELFEEYINIQELATGEFDQDEKYCLGVINIAGNKVGFIVDTYFNKKLAQNDDISIGDTLIFDTQKVRFCEENFKLQTVKNIYLVKYVPGDYIINEKTGKEQRTINYDFPIEVLRVFSRKLTAYIHVQDKGVACRYKNEVVEEAAELDEKVRISIQFELAKSMGDSNVFFAPSFPQVLKKVGIENYRAYADSIGEFVETYLMPQFCFCKNLEIGGKVHPGVILNLNGQNKDEILASISSTRKEAPVAELDEQMRLSIQFELAKSMGDSNVFFAPSFPQVLKKVGIENYRAYADSIGEFVETYLMPQFCFCKNLEINGKVHPGVILYLNGQNKDEVLAGISPARKEVPIISIDDDGKEKLQCELAKFMGNNPVLLASALPEALRNVGLEDYKKYATSVELFVELYLTPTFVFKKNLEISGKTHPGVIVLLNGRDISEVLTNIVHNNEENKNLANSVVSEELQEKISETLRAAAAETGFIYASAIPGMLSSIGILDYKQYATSIEQFCEKYAKGSFEFKDKVKIDGKVHSGVLFLKRDFKDIERTEEFLPFDDAIFDSFRDNESVHFGIINVCTGKNGFINQEYVDRKIYPDYALDGSQSTIFETPNVKFQPSTTRLRTVKYIYLVAYYVKGTVINTKNGEEQPALDYSQPVWIIKSLTRKEYARIKITEAGVLSEKFQENGATKQKEKSDSTDTKKNYDCLRELYQNADYYAFLSSEYFKGLAFCELPQDIQVAALNCAAKIISSDNDAEISLNRFQRELISNATTLEFVKKWKHGSSFDQDILEECAETSVYDYDSSKHGRHIFDCDL